MGKTRNTAHTDKETKVTNKLNRRENKMHKKMKIKDFIKSPSNQQCNKISTWLDKEHKKSPSCPIEQQNVRRSDEDVKILFMKEDQRKQQKLKKKARQDTAHNYSHDATRQKVNIETEKLFIEPFSNKYADERLLRKPRGLQSSQSSPISALNNVTPTKEKRKNEPVVLRRSPRTSNKSPLIPTVVKRIIKEQHEGENSLKRLKSSKNPSASVAKKLFTDSEVPPNSALHMWLTNHDQKKNFKPEKSIEKSQQDQACFKLDLLKRGDLSLTNKHKRSRSSEKKRRRTKEKCNKSNNKHSQDNKDIKKSDENKETVKKGKLLNSWLGKREQKGDNVQTSSSSSSSRNNMCLEIDKIKGREYKSKSQNNKEPLRKRQKLNLDRNKKRDIRVESKKYTESDNTDKVRKNHNTQKENQSHEKKKNEQKTNNKHNTQTDYKKQKKLDSFVDKKLKGKVSKKSKLSRHSSSDTTEFPSFGSTEKSSTSESFRKYGLLLPTTEGMLKEQEDLRKYKSEIENFQDIEIDSFNLPFSVKDLNKPDTNNIPILDCKSLTMDEIAEHFKKNLPYISDIFFGKTYNERHEKFFSNKYKSYKLRLTDLMCSSSVVVFTYDQKEHMINLLRDTFDSEDEWTPYFFQILLPELCLKIFMDVHNMSQEEAVKYLDIMPITND